MNTAFGPACRTRACSAGSRTREWIRRPTRSAALPYAIAYILLSARGAEAQIVVESEQKISDTSGGFDGFISPHDQFGSAVAGLGDVNGDGTIDLAVGAVGSGEHRGAVWILFMNPDGSVDSEQEIRSGVGGFGGTLDPSDQFGGSVAALEDLDGDGTVDLAVGASIDDDGGFAKGAVWILFLNTDGSVKTEQKISATAGNFGGVLEPGDRFGQSVAALGDLDGDGVSDLAVGAIEDDDGGLNQGAVWILFLNTDGTVKAEQKLSATAGGFGGDLDPIDRWGCAIDALGDLDGDGITEIAVGSYGIDAQGSLWILFLELDGTVRHEQEIGEGIGGFGGDLPASSFFGFSVDSSVDHDGDGINDLIVGAPSDDDSGEDLGALWLLYLNADGTVRSEQRISDASGGFGGDLDDDDFFGSSVDSIGDLDGDGVADLAVGASFDDDGGVNKGAAWLLFLEGPPPCFTLDFETEDDLVTPLANGQHIDTEFGNLVTLTSAGSNAGLAVFDSTPGGPNDPSQDQDLLAGTGNVLILQTENLPPDGNDVFPRPNDDDDGGTISFEFDPAVAPTSVRLIDIDSGDGTTTVVLSDGSDKQRTYTVPSNWTGDLTLAQPGQGTLDLTTLVAQPGFGSVATAIEAAGFDPSNVVRLDVQLDGSGALDDLTLCLPNLPRASATLRNGSGANPRLLAAASRPVLGEVWSADLDCTAFGAGRATLIVRRLPAAGTISPFGERLIGGDLVHWTARAHAGAVSRLTLDVPADLALCGLELHAQGLCQGASSPNGSKVLHVRARLSNAVDLIVGF